MLGSVNNYIKRTWHFLGAWVSLNGIGWGDFEHYTDSLQLLKSNKLLHRVLISHEGGWYKPEEPNGAFAGYTNIFMKNLGCV